MNIPLARGLRMVEDINLHPHFDIVDLKKEIGLLNQEYELSEKRLIEVLTRLKKVHRDRKENRNKVERLVGFIRQEQARGEDVK